MDVTERKRCLTDPGVTDFWLLVAAYSPESMASCPSQQLNTGEVIRGCVADASCKDLANFEPASLKPDHRLGAQSRRENTHVTGTRCLSWPHWHPGRSQGRIICIAPELDQNGTRRLLREEPCVRLSKIMTSQ